MNYTPEKWNLLKWKSDYIRPSSISRLNSISISLLRCEKNFAASFLIKRNFFKRILIIETEKRKSFLLFIKNFSNFNNFREREKEKEWVELLLLFDNSISIKIAQNFPSDVNLHTNENYFQERENSLLFVKAFIAHSIFQ